MSTSRYPYSGSQSASLISEVTQHFTPDVVRSARSMIGDSESSTYKALHMAAPTVLSGMANMASTSEGASNLASMIHDGGYGGLTDNPMSLFRGGSATNYVAGAGQRHLGKIFGDSSSSVTDLVARSSGVSKSSAGKLMSLITPLAMGVLGKRIATQGSGSSGLTELLSSQRDEIATAAPAGLSRILGFGPRAVPSPTTIVEHEEEEEIVDSPTHIEHFAEPTPVAEPARVVAERPRVEPTRFAQPAPTLRAPRERGGMWWLPLLLVILGAIALLAYLARARAPRVTHLPSPAVPTTNILSRIPLPGGINLSVPPGSINAQLANFLGDNAANVPRTFAFDNLNFVSGTSQLTPESHKTVTDLSEVLRAYPNAQVQLTGHTDNTGDAQSNQALSLDRANTVKTMLVSGGIAGSRITTQGSGQERPIASNTTEQGRAQNRRTELTVTRK